jgi:hypothetical protein
MERDEPNYQVEEDRLIEGEPLVTIPIPLKDICPEREDIAVANIIDGLGDCFVCLIVLCKQLGFNPGYTMNEVYKVISKRTGKLEDGLFKKDD